ncbi:ThuA domain-containing protein [Geodermatophilus sp. SYSU D00814]
MGGRTATELAVIVSGGVAHDFPATSAELARVLAEAGFTATVTEDVEAALSGLADPGPGPRPLVVLDLLRWTMRVERYAHLRERWSLSLSAAARAALLGHVRSGGGLLAVHGASICFDDWPQWRELLGGVWRWDRSSHPPLGAAVRVTVARDRHPVVAGVPDFDVVDEVYGFLDLADGVEGLMTSPHGGREHPLLWARTVGAGRVVYDALGHHVPSYAVPEHREIVRRAAVWAAGGRPG